MFQPNYNGNPDKLCRVCLNTNDEQIVSSYDKTIMPMLLMCFNGELELGDTFPVCLMCSQKIREYYNFRISVLQSQQIYNEIREKYTLTLKSKTQEAVEIETKQNIDKTNECPKCGKAFQQVKNLKEHLQRHYDARKYACEICGKKFYKQFNVTEHLRVHTGQRPFHCYLCDKTFTRNILLQNHIKKIHQKQENFICDICKKGFIDNYQLKLHLKTHGDAKIFDCTDCDKSFKTKAQLQSHVKYKHTFEKDFVCNFCGRAFTAKHTLNKHLCTHTEERKEPKHECETCGKKFLTTSQLKIHIRCAHAEESLFVCAVCLKRFATKSAVDAHVDTHFSIRLFTCYCGKSFSSQSTLNVHERCHLKEKNQ